MGSFKKYLSEVKLSVQRSVEYHKWSAANFKKKNSSPQSVVHLSLPFSHMTLKRTYCEGYMFQGNNLINFKFVSLFLSFVSIAIAIYIQLYLVFFSITQQAHF